MVDYDYAEMEKKILAHMAKSAKDVDWKAVTASQVISKKQPYSYPAHKPFPPGDEDLVKEAKNFLEFTHGKGKFAEMVKNLFEGYIYFRYKCKQYQEDLSRMREQINVDERIDSIKRDGRSKKT